MSSTQHPSRKSPVGLLRDSLVLAMLIALAIPALAHAKVCAGGIDAGKTCNFASDCRKTCAGGIDAGQACNFNSDCRKTCAGGPNAGQARNFDSNCPGS